MWSGNVSPVIRQKAKGSRPLRNLQRRANRRHVCAGYPIEPRAFSKEEIDSYFSGDKITCLLCGKGYLRLGVHIQKIHSVSEDEYKTMYGLPWSYWLSSAGSSETSSIAAKSRLEDQTSKEMLLSYLDKARKKLAETKPNMRYQPVLRSDVSMANTLKLRKIPRKYCDEDAERFLARVESGRLPKDVATDHDVPSLTWWNSYLSQNIAFKARYELAFDALPFPVQAKSQRLGHRFRHQLRILFDAGLSDHRAAEQLGVTAMSCNKITREWRKQDSNA